MNVSHILAIGVEKFAKKSRPLGILFWADAALKSSEWGQ